MPRSEWSVSPSPSRSPAQPKKTKSTPSGIGSATTAVRRASLKTMSDGEPLSSVRSMIDEAGPAALPRRKRELYNYQRRSVVLVKRLRRA